MLGVSESEKEWDRKSFHGLFSKISESILKLKQDSITKLKLSNVLGSGHE
jgi:hypothetical protein